MKRILVSLATIMLACKPAPAESNWVTRFLERYKVATGAGSVAPATDAPQALMQPGDLPLTTADIVQMLLENNRDVTVNRLVPLSSLYTMRALFKTFEPNFHITGSVDRTKSPSRSQLTGATALNQLTQNYAAGIDQSLELGTTYTVDFNLNRTSSNSLFNLVNPSWAGGLTYSMTQPFLRNLGRDTNTHQIRIAQNNEKISEVQFETQLITLLVQGVNAYWDLVFDRENVKVKQRSLDLAMKTEEDNEIQVQIGTLAPIEVVQSESEVATRHDDLVTAQYNTKLTEDQLKKLITTQLDPGLLLARLNPSDPLPEPRDTDVPSVEEALRIALESRPEMRQADYAIRNSTIDAQFTKNQLLPVLNVNVQYRQSGLGGTRTISQGIGNQIVQVVPGGVGSVFSQLFGFDYPGYTVGLTLQIPILNRGAQADYSRAVTDLRTSNKRKEAIAQQIALDVRNAYTQIDLNRARIETTRVAHQLAIRKLDAEQRKFELGTSTLRFVLEEQRNLAQAETDEIQALVNYAKALVEYQRSVGTTLKKFNIDIQSNLPIR